MSVPIVYPVTLPCPQTLALQRPERRAISSLPGLPQTRPLWRDKAGTSVPLTFVLTSEQMVQEWLDWGVQTLYKWAAWFAADWPLPEGGTGVFRFVGVPSYPEFFSSIGGWRVQANCIVRGRTELPMTPTIVWQPVLRDGLFRYSLADDFDIALVAFDETTLTQSQGTFGDVNPHPVNGPSWPVNTITPQPDTGDVIWVRKTSNLTDFVSTWHVHIVNDNTVRIWFNGVEKFGSPGPGGFSTLLDVTPVLGENVLAIRVIETLGATPTNHSQAGFEITRD